MVKDDPKVSVFSFQLRCLHAYAWHAAVDECPIDWRRAKDLLATEDDARHGNLQMEERSFNPKR